MKCFYHGVDNDGKCAGAIVYKNNLECEMIGINYNQEFPIKEIKEHEKIYIVDFSIEPEVMKQLIAITSDVIWIDHHKTAIEKYGIYEGTIGGLRNITKSGCELTWEWFHLGEEVPEAVKLIGDRDTWAWKYGDKTKYFNDGIGLLDTNPKSNIWIDLISGNKELTNNLYQIIKDGKLISKYKKQSAKNFMDSWAYEMEFKGYTCVAINKGMCGSEAFGEDFKKYDICISFIWDGICWAVSLYSQTVDVSEIAKTFEYKGKKGGGHKGASGFICTHLPF